MGNYNPVYRSLWSNQRFSELNPATKLVYLYLLTNEKTQQTGIYQILPKQIACDCNLELEIVTESIQSLIGNSLIFYWEKESLVYIYKFFKFSKVMIKKYSILDATIKRQRELIKNKQAWDIFDDEYKDELKFINESLMDNLINKNMNENKNSDNSKNNNHNKRKETIG